MTMRMMLLMILGYECVDGKVHTEDSDADDKCKDMASEKTMILHPLGSIITCYKKP